MKLEPCPFCGAEMRVGAHSAFHPPGECWMATAGECAGHLELNELDYGSWNKRARELKLLQALEKLKPLVIDKRVLVRHSGASEWGPWSCKLCGGSWKAHHPEKHNADCVFYHGD